MAAFEDTYDLKQVQSAGSLKFLFISKGNTDIIKAIQYSFVQKLDGWNIYNLGFGDYDIDKDITNDDVNTNNGDTYKVFNTVLSTIPVFFERHKDDMLMIKGSDGRPGFIEHCRLTCVKRCKQECRNYNRRINVYMGYVNKNYNQLIVDYQFLGGKENENTEGYICGKKYDTVFLIKRNP